MQKGIITIVGLVVSIGIVVLAVVLGALPVYLQSLSVDAQTATVANTNTVYQAQVDHLRAEQENLDTINASVAALRAQLPDTAQLDDVFEVIGRAAESADVDIVSISAGQQVAFTPHAGDVDETAAPAEDTSSDATDGATDDTGIDDGTGTSDAETPTAEAPASGRQQVDFAIQVAAPDMDHVTAFLDQLRAGPRLLSIVSATTVTGDEGITVQVSALTYVDGGMT